MFGFKVFTLLVIAVALVRSTPTTPAPKLCDIVCPKPLPEETVLLPNPDRCEEYCQCSPRGAIQMICPIAIPGTDERLYFNPDSLVCDWPENVDCVNP